MQVLRLILANEETDFPDMTIFSRNSHRSTRKRPKSRTSNLLRWPVVGTALAWCGIGLIVGALVHPVIAVLAGAALVALGYFVGAFEHIEVEGLRDDQEDGA